MIKMLIIGAMASGLMSSLIAANAQDASNIAGNYMCDAGCKVWDTGAHIKISGPDILCVNEVGETSRGRAVNDRSIGCFNKVGRLSSDGERIDWDDGTVWVRNHTKVF
jgi:hypothetical protein